MHAGAAGKLDRYAFGVRPGSTAQQLDILREALRDGFQSVVDRRLQEFGPLEPNHISLQKANLRLVQRQDEQHGTHFWSPEAVRSAYARLRAPRARLRRAPGSPRRPGLAACPISATVS